MGQLSGSSSAAYRGAIIWQRLILNSMVWTCQIEGDYLVAAIGGGGSGGLAPSSGNGRAVTGGQAGGLAIKVAHLWPGDRLLIIPGAGGAAQTTPAGFGNDGSDTLVLLPTGLLKAQGGGKGFSNVGAGAAGGAGGGGLAFGGDINIQGGGSGMATAAAYSTSYAITGGGAVGIYGVGYSSGTAASSSSGGAYTWGAGVGGKSGDATVVTGWKVGTAGSACAEGAGNVGTVGVSTGINNLGVFSDSGHVQGNLLAPGGGCSTTADAAEGAGGSNGYNGGMFAGGASCTAGAGAGGKGGLGGGGGGGLTTSSGAGGNGCCIIQLLSARMK